VPEPERVRLREAPEMMALIATPPEPSMKMMLFVAFPSTTPIPALAVPLRVNVPELECLMIVLAWLFTVAP